MASTSFGVGIARIDSKTDEGNCAHVKSPDPERFRIRALRFSLSQNGLSFYHQSVFRRNSLNRFAGRELGLSLKAFCTQ